MKSVNLMKSKHYAKILAQGPRPDDVGTNKPVTIADRGPAKIVIGTNKHAIRYELSRASLCGFVSSVFILRGPENVLSKAPRDEVILEIGVRFRAPVVLAARDFLVVDSYPLFRILSRIGR
jgi:hypothetical protein